MVSINAADLKYIMKMCKFFIQKKAINPLYESVNLRFENRICTATAVNGVMGIVIKGRCSGSDDVIDVNIPLVNIPNGDFDVTIKDTETEVTFEYFSGNQVVKKYSVDPIDFSKFYSKKECKVKIGFKPKLLKSFLDGIKDEDTVILELYDSVTPMMFKTANTQGVIYPIVIKN